MAKRFKSGAIKVIYTTELAGYATGSAIRTYDANTYGITFISYDTARQACALLKNGELSISRAGHISFLDGKCLKTEAATNKAFCLTGHVGSTPYDVAEVKNNLFSILLAGHQTPATHATYDSGTTSKAWRNIIANNYIYGKKIHLIETVEYASPLEGDVRYDSGAIYFYNGAAWIQLDVV